MNLSGKHQYRISELHNRMQKIFLSKLTQDTEVVEGIYLQCLFGICQCCHHKVGQVQPYSFLTLTCYQVSQCSGKKHLEKFYLTKVLGECGIRILEH